MTLLTTSSNEIPEYSAWHQVSGAIVTVFLSFMLMLAINYLVH